MSRQLIAPAGTKSLGLKVVPPRLNPARPEPCKGRSGGLANLAILPKTHTYQGFQLLSFLNDFRGFPLSDGHLTDTTHVFAGWFRWSVFEESELRGGPVREVVGARWDPCHHCLALRLRGSCANVAEATTTDCNDYRTHAE